MNKGSVNSRLLELRKKLNLSQLDFGKAISVSRSQVALLEKSQRTVNDRHIRLISSTFSVNPAWLRTGEGNMFITQEDADSWQKDEKEIIGFYKQLMPEVQVFARNVLKNLAEMNGKILKK
ncbi:helix-turn-helix domain-containing protein [Treponema primitia]|uniref:helix-turn-helix domain-containing protein n=1 Tax=Treponema primitia TaxID=88058 RepID=UPI00056E9DBC|nr:helix-turn-helix transcriptional regulator [Treponema primitia]